MWCRLSPSRAFTATNRIFNISVRHVTRSVRKPVEPKNPNWNPSSRKRNAQPAEDLHTRFHEIYPGYFASVLIENECTFSRFTSHANRLFSLKSEYIPPAKFNYSLPSNNKPEIAFIGRSNVGKSSLISALLTDKSLVRISKEPGCTKSLNFFCLTNGNTSVEEAKGRGEHEFDQNSHELYLIDLPGYGFAKVSKSDRDKWRDMIDGYIMTRDHTILKRIFILIDSRHGVKETDVDMMLRLNEAAIPYQVILTKCDSSTPEERKKSLKSVFEQIMAKRQSSGLPFVYIVSSKTGEGMNTLKQGIATLLNETHDEDDMDEFIEETNTDRLQEGEFDEEDNIEEIDERVQNAIRANLLEEEKYRD